ncbi:MAG: hypothetical protein CMJ84_12995 [Planctomycetes bacterium]|jgi:hypothetical protein|nr:hypothetical protein [Planctomycetota bacterium]MDP6410091.1 CehA/McbA family metallohydrolase [Planctomycetota bacterium]
MTALTRAAACLVLFLAPACSRADEPKPGPSRSGNGDAPPTAKPAVLAELRADLAAERHPSDGGGRAWLVLAEGEDGHARVGRPQSWTFRYEVGPHGLQVGGALYFQVPPFWGWSTPQPTREQAPGFTLVSCEAEGVELTPRTLQRTLLQVEIGGRSLEEGEHIDLTYGAGPAGALPDQYAERGSLFLFAVDGDGDGIRGRIEGCPTIDILPAQAAMLVAHLEATARPGGPVRLTVAVLDGAASHGCEVNGSLSLRSHPAGFALPERIELTAEEGGCRTLLLEAPATGAWRVEATFEGDGLRFEARSNPLWVEEGGDPVFWGDLHGHSNLSDGTGLPEDYFRYARDVAGLDLIALTDHDHYGMMHFLDQRPEMWEEIRRQVSAFHEPGRFVTLLAYEWTNWIHGHRHVLYFEDDGEVLSSLDERFDTPAELWDALRGHSALTFAHHSAGGPVATDWSFAPDPVLEPVTEVMSVHGSSEAADSPSRIYSFLPGNSVRDALGKGFTLGFVGSSDGHDGHPGLAHLSPFYGYQAASADRKRAARLGNGGLAAIRADELSRASLLAAMRARRTYATSGPRILLEVSLGGYPMGATIPAAAVAGRARLDLRVSATTTIEHVDLIRSGALAERTLVGDREDLRSASFLENLEPGEYVYLRVVQADGGLAWSSPFFLE